MNMRFERCGDMGVIHVEETRLDASVAIEFKDRFRDLTQACEGDVVLDLSAVEFLDSSGLGAVVAVRKLIGTGRRLALAGLKPAVDKVMTLTRMHTVFPIYGSVEAALAVQGTAEG